MNFLKPRLSKSWSLMRIWSASQPSYWAVSWKRAWPAPATASSSLRDGLAVSLPTKPWSEGQAALRGSAGEKGRDAHSALLWNVC